MTDPKALGVQLGRLAALPREVEAAISAAIQAEDLSLMLGPKRDCGKFLMARYDSLIGIAELAIKTTLETKKAAAKKSSKKKAAKK